jgi:arylsulfatase A-like enzyme
VVVCLDTLRADHVGAYGYGRPTTPNLDALAAGGTRFDAAWSSSNWTVPAVGSLFTGRDPRSHGATLGPGERLHLGVAPESPFGLRPALPTLAEILRRNGFATALFSGNPYLYGRFRDGFDLAVVERADGRAHLDRLRPWIEEHRAGRFYVHWQVMDLHQPIDPPEPFARRFAPAAPPDYPTEAHVNWGFGSIASEQRPGFPEYRELKVALYDGALAHVDQLLGELRATLRAAGVEDQTLIVVTADHGEEFWDHWREGLEQGVDPRGIWGIGHGHSFFEELLRVPLVIAGPSVPEGRTVECPVSITSLFATVVERVGVAGPAVPVDAESLEPHLRPDHRTCAPQALFAEAPAYGPDGTAVRYGRWKLVRRLGLPTVLYDLAADPAERADVAAANPRAVAALERLLERRAAAPQDGPPAPEPPDEALRSDLRALGYLN